MVNTVGTNRELPTLKWISPWNLAVGILAFILISPILAVFVAAGADSDGLWWHLLETVLPRYVTNTLVLMMGVAIVTLVFGVTTAWIVARYEFVFRGPLEWMLLLPAAVPAYLIAYTYTDFLEYAGPVQGALRQAFGWQNARDYWFPEIRSMEGAVFVMGAVLYPYVYMMMRIAILLTPATYFEIAMLAGRSKFWRVALPLSRPAISAGLALVLMETISDFGTVEYFAIETLTLGIFNVWLGMNNLAAAAQIACVAFLFVIILLVFELKARAHRRFHETGRRSTVLRRRVLTGIPGFSCLLICSIPIILGFAIPVGVLLGFVIEGYSLQFETEMLRAAGNSFSISAIVAFLVVVSACLMLSVTHFRGGKFLYALSSMASTGYAFPGTLLAIGVVTAAGAIDSSYSILVERLFGIPSQALLSGTIGLVIFACVVRFQAIGYGAINSGLSRLPTNLMNASRVLGHSFGNSLISVVLPLIKLSMITGGLLVFVDVMKELPMTLLLRPFNFETLATFVYQYAKDELLEEAALPALAIILTGILPVFIMNATIRRAAGENQ
ncbi:MAG: iron ABC transporter permease [Pseudomonadota bacterium]